MLYTFSKAQYDLNELNTILKNITKNDMVVLWQDGVLQAVKNPQIFANLPQLFLLENDVNARGLNPLLPHFKQISLSKLVKLTEVYFPQVGF